MSDFVEVKTAELVGSALDWAVAMADGWKADRPQDGQVRKNGVYRLVGSRQERSPLSPDWHYAPSTDWSHGGPQRDKYKVDITCEPGHHMVTFTADVHAFMQGTHVTTVDRTPRVRTGSSGFLLTSILNHVNDCLFAAFTVKLDGVVSSNTLEAFDGDTTKVHAFLDQLLVGVVTVLTGDEFETCPARLRFYDHLREIPAFTQGVLHPLYYVAVDDILSVKSRYDVDGVKRYGKLFLYGDAAAVFTLLLVELADGGRCGVGHKQRAED